METIKLKTKVEKNGNITLNIPTKFQNSEIEMIIIMNELPLKKKEENNNKTTDRNKYDFSKFSNKLNWQGDAVKEQRKLRDEWE